LKGEDGSLSTLSHGIQLLCAYSVQEPVLGVSELARRLNVSKSATQRLVATFVAHGFLKRTEGGRYRLGMRLFELASHFAASFELREVALPHLRQLSREAQETVHLAVPDGAELVYIEKIEANRTIRMYSRIGRRGPMSCTGVGKAVLAFDVDGLLEQIIAAGLPRFTAHTITDPQVLRAELASIRQQGYSFDREEIEEGLRCVAAPVRDHSRSVIAGISVAGPSQRMTDQVMRQLAPRVVDTACRISIDLGYPGG
jgi:DNA-binding IclR family transcriptional regulator